ncbi:MAG: hypothetical protein LBU42_04485 [Prevotellaceae bacterium]|jgi:hypothetical protein|nr:hypothetical protein [Prevotellaceae bacterium]
MKTYKTIKPCVIFSINIGGEKKEYILKQGDVVELPEEENVVRTLLARRLIEPAEPLNSEPAPEERPKKTNKQKK